MNNIDIDKVDLNLLKSLRALISEQHVGNAAKRMHVSQSAMSHTLARLRETFDDPLFIRTSRGLEPTARAVSISSQLSSVLDEISVLLTPENVKPEHIKTRFRLQTHSFVIAGYLAPFFDQMHKLAPGLIFEAHGISEFSFQQLDKGRIDLMISAAPQVNYLRLKKVKIIEEERVCLVDKHHPGIDNWGTETYLSFPHFKNMLLDDKVDPVSTRLHQLNLPARKIGFYTDNLLTQAAALKQSELIATLPRSLAEFARQQYGHVILPCPITFPKVIINAVWHERNDKNRIHVWLRDQLVSILAK